MNLASIVILLVIVIASAAAIFHVVSRKGKGDKCGGCGLRKYCEKI